MPLPSASKLELAMRCAGSAVYPRTERLEEAAQKGQAIHEYLRLLASMSREEALARVPDEYRARCEDIDVSALPLGVEWQAEVALAYDVEAEATRLVGLDIGRRYGERQAPGEMFMSLDTAAVVDGVGFVGDWKTGQGRVTSAQDNWQLKAQALAYARWKGVEEVSVAVVKLPADGTPYFDVAVLDAFELALAASELRELYRRVTAAEVTPVMGEHCRYCPAFESCPAQGKLIARMARSPEQIEADVLDMLTPENAARAYERLRAVDAVMKRVWKAVFAYVRERPIRLEDGSLFGEVEVEKEVLDAAVVRRVLTQMHGQDVADVACDFETSKAAVERALRPVYEARKAAGAPTTLKALKEAVYRAVEAEGGVATVKRVEVKAHRPGAEEGES